MENPYASHRCTECKKVATAAIKSYRAVGTGRYPEDQNSISTVYHCSEHVDKAVRLAKWSQG
jgi:hypothetical protein